MTHTTSIAPIMPDLPMHGEAVRRASGFVLVAKERVIQPGPFLRVARDLANAPLRRQAGPSWRQILLLTCAGW